MNAQEVFNKVAVHLFKQGQRCVNTRGQCLYRGAKAADSPDRCAIGALIPDDKYDDILEGDTIEIIFGHAKHESNQDRQCYGVVTKLFDDVFPNNKDKRVAFLTRLQCTHDHIDPWSSSVEMRRRLLGVAESYNLDASVLNTLSFTDR
jgi:hypothetical protein